ncbi:MAG TPA: 3D-(3,5/4)-trihydroxycyclohexane-1,2-dione acylhydrolase (decyclizing) [Thermoanaerobaculia bacterium]|jgi:3D-(3,5/4)-trihydroxycyclohexane-1,2-dione acylhydrolase (decyclizing)|nr:3D-(3,5/4)-trihydroxycyclohexane-1,2-dione acylhydrolase (decyclizing) [Thermoanaerobaculia bacterium]
MTVRLTMSQALVRFLDQQWVERDGQETKFVAGVMGIFGHGNVTGIGEALENEEHSLPFVRANNEQGMVHAAIAYAKQLDRTRIWACTSSIGPGATNMVTAAATATINRIPVLLLPGDIFADRQPDPVLQQLEHPGNATVSVNDCFIPVSRYFDRISRPEQLVPAMLNAMRVLTDPAATGAVTIALPQDVQSEAFDYPDSFFARRVWRIGRTPAETRTLFDAAAAMRAWKRPLIVAGGGVHYSDATETLANFATRHGIPVAETQAGKSAMIWTHPMSVGGVGVTGTLAANRLAQQADGILVVGSRLSDFTTASKSFLSTPQQQRIHINVDRADAMKLDAMPLLCDARTGLETLDALLGDHATSSEFQAEVAELRSSWIEEVDRLYNLDTTDGDLPQTAVLGRLNHALGENDVIVCAAGSLPGDLHRLWRPAATKSYHLEYGYSCMGYEVAGAFGAKLAHPDREVWALVGDGSFLMLHSELVTALEQGVRIHVVLFDNRGFQCIRGLQQSQGSAGFGNELHHAIDFAACAEALGVTVFRARTLAELDAAIAAARESTTATLIEVKVDRDSMTHGYESWWRVGVADVSRNENVTRAATAMRQRVQQVKENS